MKIFNQTKKCFIADRIKIADTFLSRMIGLLNRAALKQGEALIITRCNSIHMFFMRFAIDVIFINKDNQAIGLVKSIKPFQLSPIFWKANQAIELPAGVIEQTKTSLGDQIKIQPE